MDQHIQFLHLKKPGSQGSNSIFSTITSTGGGAGVHQVTCMPNGRGGSGGGGTCNPSSYPEIDSNGNTPPVSPAQGFPGGRGTLLSPGGNGGGGGGGATVKGTAATGGQAGPGGAGATSEIDGSSVTRAGGGGGGFDSRNPGTSAGAGGSEEEQLELVLVIHLMLLLTQVEVLVRKLWTRRHRRIWYGGSGIVIIRYKFQ